MVAIKKFIRKGRKDFMEIGEEIMPLENILK